MNTIGLMASPAVTVCVAFPLISSTAVTTLELLDCDELDIEELDCTELEELSTPIVMVYLFANL